MVETELKQKYATFLNLEESFMFEVIVQLFVMDEQLYSFSDPWLECRQMPFPNSPLDGVNTI